MTSRQYTIKSMTRVGDYLLSALSISLTNRLSLALVDSHPGRSRLEVIYEDIGEDGPSVLLRPRKQYGSANVVQFTRPISSQDDIPQGFSFEKVKSQQIDFSGRPGQKKYKCMKPNLPETASPVQQLKPAESLLVAQELHQKALPVTSSSRPINVTENPLVSEPRSTISRSVVGPVHEDLRATDRIPEIPDTLNEIQTLDVVGISGQQGTNPSQHVDLARVESNPETIIPKPVLQQWKHPPSKVIRSRKKPQTASPSDRPQTATQAPDSRSAPTDEELLSVLLSRYKREQQRKDAFRTSQQAKDIEIQELKDISDSMHHDLLQAREEIRAKERELSKYYTCTSQWKDKIQKLNDHVKSLEAGHLKLREGSKELQIQQADVRADKAMLDKMLAMVHEEVQYDRSKAETVLIEAKHHMKILEQTVETQKAQLHKDGDLLNAERTRSQRLEDEMAEITKNYHDLTTIFRGQHDTLAHKLDHMIERNDFVHDQTLPQNQAEMKNLLDRCIKILHELQGVDMVKPLDIQNLDISVKNYAQE